MIVLERSKCKGMSKIIKYKEETYDFETLILMSKDNNFKSMIDLEEEVTLIDTGNIIKIKDIYQEKIKRDYILKENIKHLSPLQRNKINKAINESNLNLNKTELWQKFKENTITIEELEQLMFFEEKNMNVRYLKGFYVNKTKDKPVGLSDDYYGKFFRLLHLMNYGNTIRHDNSNPIKKEEIYKFLGMKTERAFEIFIKNLSKFNMIAKIKKKLKEKDVNYLIINPSYANMNLYIDNTIYELFKEDLREVLSDLEIRYLELKKESNGKGMISYE